MIKLRTLSRGECSGLSRWAQCNPKLPSEKEAEYQRNATMLLALKVEEALEARQGK